jgi:hypothetical protein
LIEKKLKEDEIVKKNQYKKLSQIKQITFKIIGTKLERWKKLKGNEIEKEF